VFGSARRILILSCESKKWKSRNQWQLITQSPQSLGDHHVGNFSPLVSDIFREGKKCKEKIEKDELRIGTNRTTADDIVMTSWVHAKCFTLPKKIDSDSFLQSLDMSTLSDSQKEEIEQFIQNATPGGKRKAVDGQDAGGKKIKVVS
jgi:hypothetical protein